jgi:hypothetical protein
MLAAETKAKSLEKIAPAIVVKLSPKKEVSEPGSMATTDLEASLPTTEFSVALALGNKATASKSPAISAQATTAFFENIPTNVVIELISGTPF